MAVWFVCFWKIVGYVYYYVCRSVYSVSLYSSKCIVMCKCVCILSIVYVFYVMFSVKCTGLLPPGANPIAVKILIIIIIIIII